MLIQPLSFVADIAGQFSCLKSIDHFVYVLVWPCAQTSAKTKGQDYDGKNKHGKSGWVSKV